MDLRIKRFLMLDQGGGEGGVGGFYELDVRCLWRF